MSQKNSVVVVMHCEWKLQTDHPLPNVICGNNSRKPLRYNRIITNRQEKGDIDIENHNGLKFGRTHMKEFC